MVKHHTITPHSGDSRGCLHRSYRVLISTAADNVSVMTERPDEYELTSPEWREATEAEYARYLAYWDAHYDAEEAGLPLPYSNTFTAEG